MWDWANEKVTNCSTERMLNGLPHQSQLMMLASVIRHSFPLSRSPHIIIAAALLLMIEAACKVAESSLIRTISKVIAPILLDRHLP